MHMNLRPLTIVIPTRDRPDLLQLCLRSVFEYQTTIPDTIVSDNSSSNHPEVDALRRRYRFDYVRQSGELSITDHHNTCLSLPSSPWVMLLHDDDELYPGCVAKVVPFLEGHGDVGMIVGGLQYLDPHGNSWWDWTPESGETLKGEDALLRLGLDFHARSPNTVLSVAKGRHIGGFPEIGRLPADYTFFCWLAYLYGLAFVPERVGRYRWGHEQATKFATPEDAEAHLRYCVQMVKLIRPAGCSVMVADRLVDNMTWGLFLFHAARWRDSDPAFVFRLCQECLLLSPQPGAMQARARREYALLF